MEDHELIAKAKLHFVEAVPKGASPPSPEDFPRVRVRETAMVCFESDDRRNRVFVLLDRATGDLVGGGTHNRGQS